MELSASYVTKPSHPYFDVSKDNGAVSSTNVIVYNSVYTNNGSHYNNRGLSKINLGDYKSGCVDLSKALELNYSEANDNINNYCT